MRSPRSGELPARPPVSGRRRKRPKDPRLTHAVRLTLAYDGTNFNGWQAQPKGRTVQQELEAAIDAMGIERTRVRGCSRTDSGVHAEGQIAAFDCDRAIAPRGWLLGLNGLLPEDIAVRAVEAVEPGYDPRFDSTRKLYRYLLNVGLARDPLLRRHAWHVSPRFGRKDISPFERKPCVPDYFDLEAMREIARMLEGTHDFHAFRAVSDRRENTVRTMHAVRVREGYGGRADLLAIEVEGDAFMKNMVRILVGTLVEVGRHKMTAPQVRQLLDDGRRPDAGPTAPAHGLTLVKIWLGRLQQSCPATESE